MTQRQLIEAIKQLPIGERLALLEEISRGLREALESGNDAAQEARVPGEDLQQRRAAKMSAVRRLSGIAKPDGPPPSDEEIKDDYTRYLEEKYS